jgi:hypothetical protein
MKIRRILLVGTFLLVASGVAAQLPFDALVNDPATDIELSTQSETSIVVNGNTVCTAWNDSGSLQINRGPTAPWIQGGFSGFAVSMDGGLTFSDGGPFPPGPGPDADSGDPSLAYSVRDDTYYYAALSDEGISLWASTDDCQSFQYVGPVHSGSDDDKELMAVDNDPASPYYGRIHIGWTDFAELPDSNVTTYSDDGGGTWSTPVPLPGSGRNGQGMWPAVAPNGDVYFALVNRSFAMGGTQDQWIYRSTDGGDNWVQRTDIGTAQLRPENVAASTACGRQALNGDIRNLSSPQIAIHEDATAPAGYVIHATYPYDSDGAGPDESNVFYRRSVDGAASWSAELLLNDDGTDTDQFFPALGVNAQGHVAVSWYDRRLDTTDNMLFDRYAVVSYDGGLTFGQNVRISDVSSGVADINPNFDKASNACVAGTCELFGNSCTDDDDCFNPGVRDCYHGDYDQVAVDDTKAHIIWSDDRRVTATGPNPDVYYGQIELNTAPVADAGDDQVVECEDPAVEVTLDGSGSFDPDGDVISYTWTGDFVEGGGTVTGVSPTVTFESLGDFEAELTVEDPFGLTDSDTVTISVVDTTAPEVACVEGVNPSGKNVPQAGGNKGQSNDGFYELVASDACDPEPQIFVTDAAGAGPFGPFASGDVVKITESPSATPTSKPMGGAVSAHIILGSDAVVLAEDASGNSASVVCLVPPPPK